MANALLWDAHPSADTLIATDGALKNLAAAGVAVSAEVTNGTDLKTLADFELYIHDLAAAPAAGGYFELHIVYQYDGTNFADGEDGDVAAPHLSANTLHGIFPIYAGDEDQRVPLNRIEIGPHDFKVCVVNKTSQAIPNTDGSTLKCFRYSLEAQ
jgi:hypothetical protein